MRLVYVVQRYGATIGGGAEQHCREMAERLAQRGHDIHVVTTCAQSYIDWADVYPPGTAVERGVTVHRFPVGETREIRSFDALTDHLIASPGLRPMELQEEWMRRQGPYAPDIPRWLAAHGGEFDCVIFFTYLYWTTWQGLRTCAGAFPTLLHPTVHDEPVLRFSIFDQLFRAPDAFALSTPEEIELIARRFHVDPVGAVIGIGVEQTRADIQPFRDAYPAVAGAPYLLYVGRVDAGKGAVELYRNFVEYKQRNPSRLQLVYLGDAITTLPDHPDVLVTGFVGDDVRDAAVAGALALAQPSYFESFSMILTEAFAQSRPALVQARCEVLKGHAERSNAAIPYRDAAEFEAALRLVEHQAGLADALGANGRAYVEAHYRWNDVLDRYEALLEDVASRRPLARARPPVGP